jgi:hypothetical protein
MRPRRERALAVNRFLGVIAAHGRRFFHHNGEVSRFEVDQRGRVWFIDSYTHARIYTHYHGRWRGFTQGGTLKSLCENFREFIMHGTQLNPKLFGPWPEWYCNANLWGYGDDMKVVRRSARDLSIIKDDGKDKDDGERGAEESGDGGAEREDGSGAPSPV